jgi:hypothetical protein
MPHNSAKRLGAGELPTSSFMDQHAKSFVPLRSLVGVHDLCLEFGKFLFVQPCRQELMSFCAVSFRHVLF